MRGPVNKILLILAFVISLLLTGCGNRSLSGESENWKGRYTGFTENNENVREFVITSKDKGEVTIPVSYTISAKKDDIDLSGTKQLDSDALNVTTRCSHCRIALRSKEIIIELEWGGSVETLVLSK